MVQQNMARWIAENNILQFQRQIEAEKDVSMRKVLEGLLDREKLKLKEMRPGA
jgi:hypothetical protein